MSLPRPGPDRAAVVTGASSGIGREIARELARRGHRVTLVARRAERLAEVAAGIEAEGGRADILAADLSDRRDRAKLLERIAGLHLAADILVNSAGLSTTGAVAASDPEAEMHMIEVDVVAVADLCSRFVPGMVEAGRGAVLNVASTGAFQPVPGQAGYGASKAFVLSYTEALAGELHGTGVTATALCPGPVHTGFGEAAGISKADAEAALPQFMWVSAEVVAKAGIDGLSRGRMVVVPGAANRLGAAFANLTPTGPLVRQLARRHPGLRRNPE